MPEPHEVLLGGGDLWLLGEVRGVGEDVGAAKSVFEIVSPVFVEFVSTLPRVVHVRPHPEAGRPGPVPVQVDAAAGVLRHVGFTSLIISIPGKNKNIISIHHRP